MLKQLYVAFTAEGATDEVFLSAIIRRTLLEMSIQHEQSFELTGFSWLGASKGEATIHKIKQAYEEGNMILVVHRDTDQHGRAQTISRHIQPLFDSLSADIREAIVIVPLIIAHEQETWLLADLPALNKELKTKHTRKSLQLPRNLEDRAGTKQIFKSILREAKATASDGKHLEEELVVANIAATLELKKLALLPSYQHFLADLNSALRQIGYIR